MIGSSGAAGTQIPYLKHLLPRIESADYPARMADYRPYDVSFVKKGTAMASIVYHTNKKTGVKYAYESTSYWDKEKKQPRSIRRYIGKLDPETGEIIPCRKGTSPIRSQDASDIIRLRTTVAEQEKDIAKLEAELSKSRAELSKSKAELEEQARMLKKIAKIMDAMD